MNKLIIAGLVGVIGLGVVYVTLSSKQETEIAKLQMAEEEIKMMEKLEMEKAAMEKKEMDDKAMMDKEAMMKDETMMKDEKKMMEGEGEAMMKKDEMMKDEAMEGDAMIKKDEGAMMNKGSYEVYNASKLVMAEKGDVVLFFKASWCPSCRALDADIKANLGNIKEGLTILEVNYDTETALKQKYGVTSQHTLVQVDKDGNLIAKWSGSGTLATLEAKVQ